MDSPLVGIHQGIPAEVYHLWPGVSNSMLGKLAESPAHLRDWMDRRDEEPDKPTDAQRLGTAVHCAVLADLGGLNGVAEPSLDLANADVSLGIVGALEEPGAGRSIGTPEVTKCHDKGV